MNEQELFDEVYPEVQPPGCRTEDKEEWRAKKDDHDYWQSQLDESQEEAIYFGELRKAAKDLNIHLPDGYNIEIDYGEMGNPRVSILGPRGIIVSTDGD